jgi:hypothetical protein
MTDRRRFHVIETRMINADTYWLVIDGQMWSEVEWSQSRQRWCIQTAAGMCLAHTEAIVGVDKDPQTAIRLAKKMIVNGEMPTPEEALEQLKQKHEAERLGEPMPILGPRERRPEPSR